jgi:hypothetical protein
VTVAFAAPRGGPTGAFEGANGGEPSLFLTATDASGVARARLKTNAQTGVYLVEALASDHARATVAITQVAGVSAPGDLVLARRAGVAALAGVPGNLVHGPFVLVAGTSLAPEGPETTPVSLTAAATSLFFISDDLPDALHAHPFRYLLAASTTITETPVAASWEPVVTFPGQPASRPGPPGRSYGELLVPDDTPVPVAALKRPEDGICGIVSYGPPDIWLKRSPGHSRSSSTSRRSRRGPSPVEFASPATIPTRPRSSSSSRAKRWRGRRTCGSGCPSTGGTTPRWICGTSRPRRRPSCTSA